VNELVMPPAMPATQLVDAVIRTSALPYCVTKLANAGIQVSSEEHLGKILVLGGAVCEKIASARIQSNQPGTLNLDEHINKTAAILNGVTPEAIRANQAENELVANTVMNGNVAKAASAFFATAPA
jgi:hypothetical protein